MADDACCQRPPVSADYAPSGYYTTIAGLKTYIVPPTGNPTRAIINVYDAFGFSPGGLQGADLLSAQTSALVLVPDFFEGDTAKAEWFPPDTPEKQEAFARFRKERADPAAVSGALLAVRKEVAEKWPDVDEHVGVFGLCFGGKIVSLVAGEGNEGPGRGFTVSGTAHPSALEAKDAEALNVPHICLASPGEPADIVAQYKEILSRPGKIGHVETYDKMFHGWMGARANLKDETNLAEYERGYKQTSDFFSKYL